MNKQSAKSYTPKEDIAYLKKSMTSMAKNVASRFKTERDKTDDAICIILNHLDEAQSRIFWLEVGLAVLAGLEILSLVLMAKGA